MHSQDFFLRAHGSNDEGAWKAPVVVDGWFIANHFWGRALSRDPPRSLSKNQEERVAALSYSVYQWKIVFTCCYLISVPSRLTPGACTDTLPVERLQNNTKSQKRLEQAPVRHESIPDDGTRPQNGSDRRYSSLDPSDQSMTISTPNKSSPRVSPARTGRESRGIPPRSRPPPPPSASAAGLPPAPTSAGGGGRRGCSASCSAPGCVGASPSPRWLAPPAQRPRGHRPNGLWWCSCDGRVCCRCLGPASLVSRTRHPYPAALGPRGTRVAAHTVGEGCIRGQDKDNRIIVERRGGTRWRRLMMPSPTICRRNHPVQRQNTCS